MTVKLSVAKPRTQSLERKRVTISEKTFDMNSLSTGCTFGELFEQLEQLRSKYLEHEVLYKHDVRLDRARYGTTKISVTRYENDDEYNRRLLINARSRESSAKNKALREKKKLDALQKKIDKDLKIAEAIRAKYNF